MEMDERKLRGGAALQWRNQSRRSGGTRAQMLFVVAVPQCCCCGATLRVMNGLAFTRSRLTSVGITQLIDHYSAPSDAYRGRSTNTKQQHTPLFSLSHRLCAC
jgi:hypothetical protein